MIDLEQVIEKAENIYNFYLDSNWEFRFFEYKHTKILIQWQIRGWSKEKEFSAIYRFLEYLTYTRLHYRRNHYVR